MTIKKITAIVNELSIAEIEKALLAHGVTGFTVTSVKGRGRYCNTFEKNQLVTNSQIEIFSNDKHAYQIAKIIMDIADVGIDSEGLISIMPVDSLFWVYKQAAVLESTFNFIDNP